MVAMRDRRDYTNRTRQCNRLFGVSCPGRRRRLVPARPITGGVPAREWRRRMAATEEELFACLRRLGIETRTVRHPPVHTVSEARALRGDLPGGHAKSLLLRDRRGRLLLAVVDEERRLDLNALARRFGLRRLSFASPERLRATLGVAPGSVTPFALINRQRPAPDAARLDILIDRRLMEKEPLHFHPLHNRATTAISREDLLRFIRHCGYQPLVVDLDGDDPAGAAGADGGGGTARDKS
ncbi:MAG: prolyl-tRNA synthetase associated domain-containing protein [Alphaproteobacteria bacterium]|nr:MAG: prolyl-tRNA synthetase associated domain-containing protein [Alphaproteobacteria bacterium]